MNLIINIRSYWHPGTGRGSGFHLDALTHTGADGLPRLPGRHLKGLLRDALYRAETWQWPDAPAGITEALFGSRPIERNDATAEESAEDATERNTPNRPDDDNLSTPGLLRVSDATLPTEVAKWLASDDGKPYAAGLYREHFGTAIDERSGVAKERSLRGMQVIVPLELTAIVREVPGVKTVINVADWKKTLAAVFPLIPAVGAHRTRGFGRACLSWQNNGG